MTTSDMFAAHGSLAAAMQDSAPAAAPKPFVCPDCDEQVCVCWMYDDPAVAPPVEFKVELERRKSSIALCATCSHTEKAHGWHTGACLQKIGGRFDGASDQTRCRCTAFVAQKDQTDETGDTESVIDLFEQLTLSMFKVYDERIARLEKQVSGLLARETV